MKKGLIFITGLLTNLLGLYYVILWFFLFKENTGTFEALKILYLTYYPGFIGGTFSATVFIIVLCVISFFCFLYINTHEKTRINKMASKIMMIVNIILFSWLLWTMM